jgi:hypothetical protein
MKIKNRLVLDEQFVKSFSELMIIGMPAKQCLEVSAAIDELSTHYNILIRARKAIADKYCKKGEEGEPIVENGNIVFEEEELKKKFLDELEEINNEEIDLPLTETVKIHKNQIMTPLKVKLLRDIIEIVE